jgi:hypothetical protein
MGGPDQLMGAPVVDKAGRAVGAAAALLVDPQSLEGRWLRIALIDNPAWPRRTVVPLAAASVDVAGRMVLPWSADTVANAPQVGDQISDEQAFALDHYYGLHL